MEREVAATARERAVPRNLLNVDDKEGGSLWTRVTIIFMSEGGGDRGVFFVGDRREKENYNVWTWRRCMTVDPTE